MSSWILPRPIGYDPTLTWNEDTGMWVSTQFKGVNSYQQRFVVVSELGVIFWGDV